MPDINCPICGSRGGGKDCASCHGTEQAIVLGDKALYWGKRIDNKTNTLARAFAVGNAILNFSLLIFGIVGAGIIVYLGYIYGFDAILTSVFWRRPDALLLVFWLSVWSDFYLVYRIMRESELTIPVARKPFEEEPLETRKVAWEEAEKIPRSNWIDVSKSYTPSAINALRFAYKIAAGRRANEVGLIHIFAGLLTQDEIAIIFGRLGIRGEILREKVSGAFSGEAAGSGEPRFAGEAIEALALAYGHSYEKKKKFVDPTALLLAISEPEGKVKEILYDLEIDKRKIANVIAWHDINNQILSRYRTGRAIARRRPTHEAGRAMTAVATPYLDQFGQDLTLAARYGRLSPVVGREKEIQAIFRAMEGGLASVVLVGERGVGKDAIIEGIAERMVEEDVPKILSDKRLVSLSAPRILAGASAEAAAERLYHIFFEISRAKNVILYIPNIHELVSASGGLDLAQTLATELGKHYFFALGSTNPDDYKLLAKTSLGHALEKVEVPESDLDDTIQILESKAGLYEYQNKVFFSYDAVEKAASLSDKYLVDRFLPEKAIEILREASHAVAGKRGAGAVVGGEDVAEIISEKSHVPVTKVGEEEKEKLLNLEERMASRVVGQKEAVKAVAAAIRRARAGLRAGSRPIANFLFLGPTGVGKTETAKTVAEVYFGNEENMIRLDMSEYQDQSSLYRMIGEPGGSSGGLLTEAVRGQPFTLLLLDEIEKAHPDILNVFLQVMDDGRLTDNIGRTVDFTNVILIATSNAGTDVIQDEIKKGTAVEQIKNLLINQELRNYFRPEFLNRFDGVIVFTPLSEDEIRQVAGLMLKAVAKQLEQKGVALKVTDEALVELAQAGFDPVFGARPLRRVIQEKVQDALANFLLQNKIGRRDTVILEAGGNIRIEKAEQL
ncbi:ATP-dependent Clp protease ATP-binding subunit [Candidatus Uhrbacteria bacterium]|nr:ATP-dependent Clp protease ATP-binding subunit [Candidatus Uhrbacteria bacterium]